MTGHTASGAWICHTGKVRKVNEDACLFGGTFGGASTSAPITAAPRRDPWLVALADGIGGHRAGAYASREALVSLAAARELSTRGIEAVLQETNRRLHEIGRERPDLEGTGAAVVGLAAGPDGLFGFNVGDARLYRQDGPRVNQVSRDDSVEQLLVNEGLMEPSDGVRSSYLHALTQSVGGSAEYHPLEPHFYPLPLTGATRFILCTDGLTDMLSLREIESFAVEGVKPSALVQALFAAAMDAGGRDNITIAVVDVEPA